MPEYIVGARVILKVKAANRIIAGETLDRHLNDYLPNAIKIDVDYTQIQEAKDKLPWEEVIEEG